MLQSCEVPNLTRLHAVAAERRGSSKPADFLLTDASGTGQSNRWRTEQSVAMEARNVHYDRWSWKALSFVKQETTRQECVVLEEHALTPCSVNFHIWTV